MRTQIQGSKTVIRWRAAALRTISFHEAFPGSLSPCIPLYPLPLHPCTLTIGTRSPCSMISLIFLPFEVLHWASCHSSWPSPTWQKPYLVTMFLYCVPLPQPGLPVMIIREDLRISMVPRKEGGRGVSAFRGQGAPMCSQFSACVGHRSAGTPLPYSGI